jgi:hypothetical protein
MTIFGPDIEATGTDPYESELISIQYRDDEEDENHLFLRWDYESEADLLFDFFMDYYDIPWKRTSGGPLRVGFRVTDFDLPFILVRAYETGAFEKLRAGPGFVWTNVIAGPSYLDLSHLLGADMASFEQWREELVETESPSGGAKMPELYENEEYDRIIEYITDELEAMEEVYNAVSETEHFQSLMESRQKIGFERELR